MPNPRGTLPPQTLLQNRYRILSQIGEGGMGAVYVATDERFGSTVALKETFFTDASLRRAFEREAQLLNRLRHPALPKVSDHFAEGEGQFLVMEFIAGEDLSEMLERRGSPFPLADVLRWADDLLDALDYLHTQEPPIVHRDIKPQNLKLTPRGHVVLLDFGLAKGTPLQTSQATKSVFGYSRNYAPLEQIQGTGTDVRSDIYSLGATLYHLLTGHTPTDALTRAMAVLNNQPDPLRHADALNPQVGRAVSEVIARAMAQTAPGRQQSAAELREELRRAATDAAAGDAQRTRTAFVHAPTHAPHSEQETRIFGAHAARTTADGAAHETAAAPRGTAAAPHDTSGASRGTAGGTSGGTAGAQGGTVGAAHETVNAAHGGETTMYAGHAADEPTRVMSEPRAGFASGLSHAGGRSITARRGGLVGLSAATVAGLALLCAAAFGVYKFVERPAPSAHPAPSAQPSPHESARPQDPKAAGTHPDATDAPDADAAAEAEADADHERDASAAERRAAAQTRADRKRRASSNAEGAGGADPRDPASPAEPGDPGSQWRAFNFNFPHPTVPPRVFRRAVIPPGVDWSKLTPEERKRLIDRIQREATQEHQRALEQMRKEREREREGTRQGTTPAPPRRPTPPPPTPPARQP